VSEPYVYGMGAIPYAGGCAFRVWAPHADNVSVRGDFNNWIEFANPMRHDGWGYWYTAVAGAHASQQYRFRISVGWQHFDRIDPYAHAVTSSMGNGIIHDHGHFDWQFDDFHIAEHNELVIHEVHVGSFHEAWGGRNGTFEQLTNKIGHFLHLGINAVELMPVCEFAGNYSWGYNPAHMFAVESSYGGPDGLKTFVRECHRYGIAVILDVVYNHFGPSDLDLWQFDGWSDNDKGGIYFYNDHRSVTPWGDTRPDYRRGEVRQFIHDNALTWMWDYHIDGLRYDMTAYIRSTDGTTTDLPEGFDLLRWVNGTIRHRYPGRILIAEDLASNDTVVGQDGNDAGFHTQWDGNFVHPLRAALGAYNDADRSMTAVRDALLYHYDGQPMRRVVYIESHDEVANGKARVVADIAPHNPQGWQAQKRSTLGAGITLTAPGIPMLFQGEEFLQGAWFRDDDPLDWWLNDRYQGIVVLHRDLIRLRRNLDGDTRGLCGSGINVFHCNDDLKLIAYQRWDQHGIGDDVVVVANFSHQSRHNHRIGLPEGGTWKLKLNSDSADYSTDFGGFGSYDATAWVGSCDGLSHHTSIDIAPYSVLIYSWYGG